MQAKLSEIASQLDVALKGKDFEVEILLTDSRSLSDPAKSLFFALKTESNDGHRYIADLYRKGVRAFVADHLPEEAVDFPDASFIVVPDTLKALQKAGAMGRKNARRLVAITGSRGKTTLKEWLFQMLQPTMNVSRSPRSYNSRIGVPLSLWSIRPGSDVAIIEAGISRVGEMEPLADCIRPDIVIITNVGEAHNQGFRSMGSKIAEKAKLAAPDSVKTVISCSANADLLKELQRTCRAEIISKSLAPEVLAGNMGSDFAASPLEGVDMENAANAVAAAMALGLTKEEALAALKRVNRILTRLNVSEGVNDCMIIHDSFTSDLSSLPPALDFLKRRTAPGNRKTVVLSDLIHEADTPRDAVKAMAKMLKDAGVERLIGVGPALTASRDVIRRAVGESLLFESTEEFLNSISTSDFCGETILIKGLPEFHFEKISELLEAKTHETVLEVNLDSVVKNYNFFRSKLPSSTGLVAMVKASGYGAGSYEVARTLQDCGAAYLAVAVLDEGIDLRKRGITMPVMVMNPKVVNYRQMFANRLEPEVYSMQMLRDVIREAEKYGIEDYPLHIKLDTGMHRMGFIEDELDQLMDILNSSKAVRIASAFSHLATADCVDMDDYTLLQLERFDSWTSKMLGKSKSHFLRHVLNSAGILRFPQYHYDMARLGIGLYGVNTLPPEIEPPLAVVSTLRTVIIAIREWKKGESIGYGRRTVLQRDSRIATIPIGYADGMNRHFGRGNISVKVNGQDAPTAGNICMDACMIDVTDIDCKEGDAVEIFGTSASVERLSDLLDTIPYEILTSVSPRVKRVYFRE